MAGGMSLDGQRIINLATPTPMATRRRRLMSMIVSHVSTRCLHMRHDGEH
jgi:hypothetical protein